MDEEKIKVDRTALEKELGQKLGVIRPKWEDIAGRVIAADLDIGYLRGRRRFELVDMGLENAGKYTHFLKGNVSLGQKYLLPKDTMSRLETLESQARSLLVRSSFATPIGYLVPMKSYPKFRQKIEEIRARFQSVINEIAEKRDCLVEHMMGQYAEAARAAYKASQGLAYTAEVDVPEEFVAEFITRILSYIPSAEEIRRAAKFELYPSYIELPIELEQGLLEAQRLARERRLIELEVQGKEAEARAKGAAALEQERLMWQAERERIRLEQEVHAEITQKQATLKKEKIDTTIHLLSTHLRETILDACQSVLKSINRNNNRLVGASARRLRNLIARLRALNFDDDACVEGYLSQIETQLTYRKTERGVEDIVKVLSDIGNVVHCELVALGAKSMDDPVSFLELGAGAVDADEILAVKERLLQPCQAAEEELPLFELLPIQDEVRKSEEPSLTEAEEPLFDPQEEAVLISDADAAGV